MPKSWSFWNSTHPAQVLNPGGLHAAVGQIVHDYDFIMLVERLDECFVILQLLLGMETHDVMFISSKSSQEHRLGRFGKNKKCVKVKKAPKEMSPVVQEYLESA